MTKMQRISFAYKNGIAHKLSTVDLQPTFDCHATLTRTLHSMELFVIELLFC